MIHIYIQYPTITEAKEISKILLEKRLAACVSFVRQEDMYWWKGKILHTKGVVTFITAPKKHYKKIEQFVAKHHSYEVPIIAELPVNRSYQPYNKWLYAETN